MLGRSRRRADAPEAERPGGELSLDQIDDILSAPPPDFDAELEAEAERRAAEQAERERERQQAREAARERLGSALSFRGPKEKPSLMRFRAPAGGAAIAELRRQLGYDPEAPTDWETVLRYTQALESLLIESVITPLRLDLDEAVEEVTVEHQETINVR